MGCIVDPLTIPKREGWEDERGQPLGLSQREGQGASDDNTLGKVLRKASSDDPLALPKGKRQRWEVGERKRSPELSRREGHKRASSTFFP